jgi:hypothetical protein
MYKSYRNTVTYCRRCGSMLYWDDFSRPQIIKLGDNHLVDCLDSGCDLIQTIVPEEYCRAGEIDLLRLALINMGVPEEDANIALSVLSSGHEAVAA